MAAETDRRIAAIRRFNRFYTVKLGVLSETFLNTPFSLTECRVLQALAHRDGATATWLGRELDLDPGYLSRILRDFERQGLILRNPSLQDGRQTMISLTPGGRDAFEPLDKASQAAVTAAHAEVRRHGRVGRRPGGGAGAWRAGPGGRMGGQGRGGV